MSVRDCSVSLCHSLAISSLALSRPMSRGVSGRAGVPRERATVRRAGQLPPSSPGHCPRRWHRGCPGSSSGSHGPEWASEGWHPGSHRALSLQQVTVRQGNKKGVGSPSHETSGTGQLPWSALREGTAPEPGCQALLPTALEAGTKVRVPAWSGSGESLFRLQRRLLLCPHVAGGEPASLWPLLTRALVHSGGSPPS